MKNILFTLALLVSFSSFSQTDNLEDGWKRIYVEELGSFDLPPTMEIQEGLAKKITVISENIFNYPATDIIAQQKHYNKDVENVLSDDFDVEKGAIGKGFETYARLMISTVSGAGVKLFCESSPLTATDLILGNTEIKKQYEAEMVSLNLKIIRWLPIEFKKINGMCVLHISYIRSGFKSNVKVDSYGFFNNDLQHNLTLSYRVNEENIWKKDFEKILNSFTITNVR